LQHGASTLRPSAFGPKGGFGGGGMAMVGPQLDVSFPEKFLKIVATRGEIFSLKFTK